MIYIISTIIEVALVTVLIIRTIILKAQVSKCEQKARELGQKLSETLLIPDHLTFAYCIDFSKIDRFNITGSRYISLPISKNITFQASVVHTEGKNKEVTQSFAASEMYKLLDEIKMYIDSLPQKETI